MKIFLQYLVLPFITACIVTTGVVIFYHLDVSRGTDADRVEHFPRNPASASEDYTANVAGRLSSSHFAQAFSKGSIEEIHSLPMPYEDFVYPVDDTRDPFQKMSSPIGAGQPSGNAPPSIMLTGIIWDHEDPVAIITDSDNNSYLVRTGEEISSGKILTIQPGSITIERDGRMQELILWAPNM